MNKPAPCTVPPASAVARLLPGASFFDAWTVPVADPSLSALDLFLKAARRTPRWIDAAMALRNRVVAPFGLKDLGGLAAVSATRAGADYRPGERVGIFTLIANTPDEVLLGDDDRHLKVVVSLRREGAAVVVTTVVHTRNWLGRLYMLPVTPMHKLIAPAFLARLAEA
ncbi:DUF2867 domain-containing protein [Derxia lacustris]|uniref:DUF2867 domain-containing protein n=1 Tax=Derxia lacustris TaxID=764842 RepID=UPI000A17163A|nr:DUF2867 domain-containing protein [Derxia lacustris]